MTLKKVVLEQILSRLESIEGKVARLEKARFKRGLSFGAVIPPSSLCRDVVDTFGVGNFDNAMQILSDYYGVSPMCNYTNKAKVPAGAIACYHSFEGNAYHATKTVGIAVVFHEFFHHLCANGVCGEQHNLEKLADRFSQIILKRAETGGA